MDLLGDDTLILIAIKVASHSVRDLANFMRTNTRHANICRFLEVPRAFGDDCTKLLTDLRMTHAKLDFIDRLLNDDNPLLCVLRSTQHMLHFKPCLDEIDHSLRNAITAGSWTTRYYHLLKKVTSIHPFELDEVLNDFWILLETLNIRCYRMDIRGIRTSFMF